MKTTTTEFSECHSAPDKPHIAMPAIKDIIADDRTQTRASINEETVAEYAERMEAGDEFPPIVLFKEGNRYWMADGFHRLKAAEKSGEVVIEAEIHPGGRRDALKYSLGANFRHGLRRTNADKRNAVRMALKEFGDLSDHAVAELCGVGHHLVAEIRSQLGETPSSNPRMGRDGKKRRLPQKSAKKTTHGGKETATGSIESPANADSSAASAPDAGNQQPSKSSESTAGTSLENQISFALADGSSQQATTGLMTEAELKIGLTRLECSEGCLAGNNTQFDDSQIVVGQRFFLRLSDWVNQISAELPSLNKEIIAEALYVYFDGLETQSKFKTPEIEEPTLQGDTKYAPLGGEP